MFLAALFAVIVGTWNGQWFPSGRAEHRDTPANEARTIGRAGETLRAGLAALDPSGTEDVILCFNEIRGPKAAQLLCDAIGRTNLQVAVITGYRRRDRFDMQQDVIATTLPVADAHWSKWKNAKAETPPRGYATADLVLPSSATVTVYSVHLKSNYGQTTDEAARLNRAKRTHAASQLVEMTKLKRGKKQTPVIVAGDFNADAWSDAFRDEPLFGLLSGAGFANPLEKLGPEARVTYPGHGKWKGAAFDYILLRGLTAEGAPRVHPCGDLSDHCPVFVRLTDKKTAK